MSRTTDMGRAYLLWLHPNSASHPVWANFLNDPASVVESLQATEEEVHAAVEWLGAHQLVDGARVDQESIPVRVTLTPQGLICAVEHDGDVGRWVRRGSGYVDQSTTVNSHNAQVAAHSQQVTQTQTLSEVDVDKLRAAATMALETLPIYSLPSDQATAVKQAAEQIVAEAENPTPDHGKLRQLADTVKTWLAVASTSATTAGVIISDIHAATGR